MKAPIELAKDCGSYVGATVSNKHGTTEYWYITTEQLAALVDQVIEECAVKCEGELIGTNKDDDKADRWYDGAIRQCAAAIRSMKGDRK